MGKAGESGGCRSYPDRARHSTGTATFPLRCDYYEIRVFFDFAQSLMDFELVPVFADAGLLNYVPGIAARIAVVKITPLEVLVHALYARSAADRYIPIPGLAPHLELRNNANTLIPTTFAEIAPGVYEDSTLSLNPSGNPYTIRVGASAPAGAFDYTTALAQFSV